MSTSIITVIYILCLLNWALNDEAKQLKYSLVIEPVLSYVASAVEPARHSLLFFVSVDSFSAHYQAIIL